MKLGKRRIFEEVLISLVNLLILFQPEISDPSSETDIPLSLVPRDGESKLEEVESEFDEENKAFVDDIVVDVETKTEVSDISPVSRDGCKFEEKEKAFDEEESRSMERFQRLGIFSIFTIQAFAMGILAFFPPHALLKHWSEHETMVPGNVTMGLEWFRSNASRCEVITFGSRQRCPFHDSVFYIWLVQLVIMALSGLVLHFYIMIPSNERRELSGHLRKGCSENLKPFESRLPDLCKMKNENGYLPLHELASMRIVDRNICSLVVKASPASVKKLTDDGKTVLHVCFRSGNYELATWILEDSLDPETEQNLKNGYLNEAMRIEDRVSFFSYNFLFSLPRRI